MDLCTYIFIGIAIVILAITLYSVIDFKETENNIKTEKNE